MNRLVRTLVGVVVAKAAVVAGWYLYQKSTESVNDWKTEGKTESKTDESVVKTDLEPVTEEVIKITKPVRKTKPRVKKEPVQVEALPVAKAKRVRKPVVKKVTEVVKSEVETEVPVKKVTRNRIKKA